MGRSIFNDIWISVADHFEESSRMRIRIRIKVISRIRIRIKVKSRSGRIHIQVKIEILNRINALRISSSAALMWTFASKRSMETSVGDPDPYAFGPPGSVSHKYESGSGSGSFHHQAKIVRKTLISSVFATSLWSTGTDPRIQIPVRICTQYVTDPTLMETFSFRFQILNYLGKIYRCCEPTLSPLCSHPCSHHRYVPVSAAKYNKLYKQRRQISYVITVWYDVTNFKSHTVHVLRNTTRHLESRVADPDRH